MAKLGFKKGDKKYIDELYSVILRLDTKSEAARFFRDLLTEQEILEFARRWRAAILLDSKAPYMIIEKDTGLSSATIARISRWLQKGRGGYKLMLNKIRK